MDIDELTKKLSNFQIVEFTNCKIFPFLAVCQFSI